MIKRLLIGFTFLLFPSFAIANCVVGATGVVGTGTCSKAGRVLISTQTASNSVALQFYGSNWSSSYSTLQLRCQGLINNGGTYLVQVGEGGAPTWQTSGSYVSTRSQVTSNQGAAYSGTASATDLTNQTPGSTAIPMSITLEIDNVASTTIYKKAMYQISTYTDGFAYEIGITGTGYWAGDHGAITGLQVAPYSGTIASGTCSLYGVLS